MYSVVHEFHPGGSRMPAAPVAERLFNEGLVVRPAWGIPSGLRVSIGIREHNERFLSALERVLWTIKDILKRTARLPSLVFRRDRIVQAMVSRDTCSAGYRIIPVNPLETEVLGEGVPSLDDVPELFEIVDIFRRRVCAGYRRSCDTAKC
jgi:hypothetical protein